MKTHKVQPSGNKRGGLQKQLLTSRARICELVSKLRGWTILPWNLMEFHSETHSSELRKLQQQAKPCLNKALDVIVRMAREYVWPWSLLSISFHAYSLYSPSDFKSFSHPFFWYEDQRWNVANAYTISFQAIFQQTITKATVQRTWSRAEFGGDVYCKERSIQKTKPHVYPVILTMNGHTYLLLLFIYLFICPLNIYLQFYTDTSISRDSAAPFLGKFMLCVLLQKARVWAESLASPDFPPNVHALWTVPSLASRGCGSFWKREELVASPP